MQSSETGNVGLVPSTVTAVPWLNGTKDTLKNTYWEPAVAVVEDHLHVAGHDSCASPLLHNTGVNRSSEVTQGNLYILKP
jgi:hypothetical protein